MKAYLFVAFCLALDTLMTTSVMVKLFAKRLSQEPDQWGDLILNLTPQIKN